MTTFQGARETTWNGREVRITARLVPRYAWMTASIDVFVEDRAILKTGGVLKWAGTQSALFRSGGVEHSAELSWGRGSPGGFPIVLNIDGKTALECDVPIRNRWLLYWPWAVACALATWVVLS